MLVTGVVSGSLNIFEIIVVALHLGYCDVKDFRVRICRLTLVVVVRLKSLS